VRASPLCCGRQDLQADVARFPGTSVARSEQEFVARLLKSRLIGGELVTQHRQEIDGAHAGVSLGVANADHPYPQVDILPVERERLAEAKPGEHEGRDERASLAHSELGLAISYTASSNAVI
jgi:hypothetical protein